MGSNIHRATVDGDKGSVHTECPSRPNRDMGDSDGVEPGGNFYKEEVGNWISRRRRSWKPSNKCFRGLIAAKVGNKSTGEAENDLVSRGIATEIPSPAYGYMRGNGLYVGTIGRDLASDWLMYTLRGAIYRPKRKKHGGGFIYLPNNMGWSRKDTCV